MDDFSTFALMRQRHPLAHACVALVVCLGVYQLMGWWEIGAPLGATAVAAVLAVAFMLVGLSAVEDQAFGHNPRWLIIAMLMAVAACLGAGAFVAAGGLSNGAAEGDVAMPSLGVFTVYCLLTAVFEEALFRGVLYRDFLLLDAAEPGSHEAMRALVLQAVVFAVLHMVAFPAESQLPFTLQSVTLALRIVAAFLFALVMARLLDACGSIAVPMVAHFAYDLVLFAPLVYTAGFVRTNPLAGGMADLISWAVQVVVLAVVVLACRRLDSCYHTPSAL